MSLQRPLKCACYAVGTIQPAIRLCDVVRRSVNSTVEIDVCFLLCLYVKQLRLKKGLTQQQLAEKLNLSASSLGYYENGRRVVDYIPAKRLAEMLETDDILQALSVIHMGF